MQDNLYKIYVVVEENKVSKLLIQYESEEGKFKYNLDMISSYSSTQEQTAFQQKVLGILFSDNYKGKIEFVYEGDDKYFDIEEIVKYDMLLNLKNEDAKEEKKSSIISLILTILSFPLSTLYSTLFNMTSSLWSIVAIMNNWDIKDKSKELRINSPKFHTLKRRLYLLMLVWNLSSIGSNIYLNSSKIKNDIVKDWNKFKITMETTKIGFQRKFDDIENPFEDMKDVTEENKVDLLLSAFSNNKFLSEDDKEIAMGLEKLLRDNPYINYQELYDKYVEIAIIYTDLQFELGQATYNSTDNIITDYSYTEELKKYEDYHQTEMFHEFIHVIGKLYEFRVFNEGMTELLKIEYGKEELEKYSVYWCERMATEILINLVGSDTVLKVFTTGDLTEMEEKLKAINPNPKTYKDLLEFLNMDSISEDDIVKALSPYTFVRKDMHNTLMEGDYLNLFDDKNYYNLETNQKVYTKNNDIGGIKYE